jgi:DUF1680 family protein
MSKPAPQIAQLTAVHATMLDADGWIGRYVQGAEQRHVLDPQVGETYLAWVEEREDTSCWHAEHIGKWLESAMLVWRRTRSATLLARIDGLVDRLLAMQGEDGYLGSYRDGLRFQQLDWNAEPARMDARFDLWCHLMIITGLLDHHEAAVRPRSLASARKAGDLVARIFGDGRQDLTRIMHNRGQGPLTAILPMARLYGLTGEARYAEFCSYCTRQFGRPWTLPIRMVEDPAASATAVLVHEPARQQDDGLKKCELELTMRGLLELHRHTGERKLLATSSAVFQRLYQPILPTLAVSGYLLDPAVDVPVVHHNPQVETCDIPPAMRWWSEAFRQTGEVRFLDAVERSLYNQLLAHHRPEGGHTGFDTRAPTDRDGGLMSKTWSDDTCVWRENCCLSMGALGLCWVPSTVAFAGPEGIVVALYASGTSTCQVGGSEVRITQQTTYPVGGEVRLRIDASQPQRFRLQLRIPAWAAGATVRINGAEPSACAPGTLHAIERTWQPGDTVVLSLPMAIRSTPLSGPAGRVLIERGPLVLAAPRRLNEGLQLPMVRSGAACSVAVADDGQTVFSIAGDRAGPAPLRLTALSQAGTGGAEDPYVAVFPTR